jgi:exopolyphosphatase/guanosine-5'-triphosphate,3'-diphosphate pyrophosphatase
VVATIGPDGTSERNHAVHLLGLGRQVASRGSLGPELLEKTCLLLKHLVSQAREDGAQRVGLVGTEALRNASDGSELGQRVREATGQQLRILTGELEARLSYLGATSFRVARGVPATVVDVGGGSTEVVHGVGSRPVNGSSLKLGSDRLLMAVEATDPPTPRQRVDAEMRISMQLEAAPEAAQSGEMIATGGTAANLPVLLGLWRPFPDSKDVLRGEDSREPWLNLSRDDVDRALHLTAAHSSAEVAMRTGISPTRARLMAGGVLILRGLLERYGLEELVVTERGIRDGVLLRLAATGTSRTPA